MIETPGLVAARRRFLLPLVAAIKIGRTCDENRQTLEFIFSALVPVQELGSGVGLGVMLGFGLGLEFGFGLGLELGLGTSCTGTSVLT